MLKEYLLTIANAIRAKLGTTDKINAQSFTEKINDVYDKGKYDEWSEFWDNIQTNGSGWTSYDHMFSAVSWDDKTFKPKYDFKITGGSAVQMFGGYCKITDLEAALAKGGVDGKGVKLITATSGHYNEAFTSNYLTVIPEMDFRYCSGLYNTYAGKNIHTIRKIISSKTTNWGLYAFNRTADSKLENVVIEGVIAKTFTLQFQKLLSTASIVSFIEALCTDEDITGVTVTFNQTAVNNMTFPYTSAQSGITYNSWDELANTKPNWTISIL
jgi:hypothetical protein